MYRYYCVEEKLMYRYYCVEALPTGNLGSWLLSLLRAPTKSVQSVHVAWAGRRPQDRAIRTLRPERAWRLACKQASCGRAAQGVGSSF